MLQGCLTHTYESESLFSPSLFNFSYKLELNEMFQGSSHDQGVPFSGLRTYLIPAGAGVKVDVVKFEILHAEWALLWLVVGIGVQDGHGDDGDGGGEGKLN